MSRYTKQSIHKIEMFQRRAIRWKNNNSSSHARVTHMQENLSWRSLEQRSSDARMILMYKVIHGLVAKFLFHHYSSHLCKRPTVAIPLLPTIQIHTSFNFHKYSFFPETAIDLFHIVISLAGYSSMEVWIVTYQDTGGNVIFAV